MGMEPQKKVLLMLMERDPHILDLALLRMMDELKLVNNTLFSVDFEFAEKVMMLALKRTTEADQRKDAIESIIFLVRTMQDAIQKLEMHADSQGFGDAGKIAKDALAEAAKPT